MWRLVREGRIDELYHALCQSRDLFTDLDESDKDGRTAVHWAARTNRPEVLAAAFGGLEEAAIHWLLFKVCCQNYTPLHHAALKDSAAAAVCLLEHLQPEQQMEYLSLLDNRGHTALHAAAWKNNNAVFESILCGLSYEDKIKVILIKAEGKWNCLHMAVLTGSEAVAKCILANIRVEDRAKVIRERDEKGWTSLHWAADKNDTNKIGELLLESLPVAMRREVIREPDTEGKTPVDLVINSNKLVMLETITKQAELGLGELITGTQQQTSTQCYPLTKPPLAIILCTTVGRENGAKEECQAISAALTNIGMELHTKFDLHKSEMLRSIDNICLQLPISALFLFVMAHGKEGHVEDARGNQLQIQEILTSISKPELSGFPKVLFLQSCQGSRRRSASSRGIDAVTVHAATEHFHIQERDLAVVTSTLYGQVAIRNLFLPLIATCLEQSSPDDNFYDIFIKAQHMLSSHESNQVAEYQSTLTKKLCVKRWRTAPDRKLFYKR